ncbi:hypothetical protein [Tenacibaculum sp. 190524A05c]|uniref:hypothetical protein n=1 Tax=Tenacibaculum platacis TaxID=3137852 RepID=UPI0032B17213
MKNILLITLFIISLSLNGQTNKSIERQLKLEKIKKDIDKLNYQVEELEDVFRIITEIKTNYNDNKLDKNSIKNEIDLIKSYSDNKSKSIIKSLRQLSKISFKKIINLRNQLSPYYRKDDYKYRQLSNLYFKTRDIDLSLIQYDDLIDFDDNDNERLDYNRFKEFQKELDSNKFIQDLTNVIDKLKSEVDGVFKLISTDLNKKNKALDDLTKKRIELEIEKNNESDYDRTIFQWGFPVFIIFILLLYLVPLWLLHKKQNTNEQGITNLYQSIYGTGLLTEIVTVFLLTSTILLLGITNKLNPEILGTLIGGISGYVLGRSFNATKKN